MDADGECRMYEYRMESNLRTGNNDLMTNDNQYRMCEYRMVYNQHARNHEPSTMNHEPKVSSE